MEGAKTSSIGGWFGGAMPGLRSGWNYTKDMVGGALDSAFYETVMRKNKQGIEEPSKRLNLLGSLGAKALGTGALVAGGLGATAAFDAAYEASARRGADAKFQATIDQMLNDPAMMSSGAAQLDSLLGREAFLGRARQSFNTLNKYAPTVARDPMLASSWLARDMPDRVNTTSAEQYLQQVQQMASLESALRKGTMSPVTPLTELMTKVKTSSLLRQNLVSRDYSGV